MVSVKKRCTTGAALRQKSLFETNLIKVIQNLNIFIVQKQKVVYPCQAKGLAKEVQEKQLKIDRFLE